MNKFNPEAIICADYSIDVVLFDGDLTPEECSDVFMKMEIKFFDVPKRGDVQTSNEGYLLQTYSYSSIDAYEEYMNCLNDDIDDDIPF